MWPAFWMLGDDNNGTEVWPNIGEIDIMENRGQEPFKIIGSVHGPGYSGGNAVSKEYNLENDRFDTGFHVLELNGDQIILIIMLTMCFTTKLPQMMCPVNGCLIVLSILLLI